MKATAADSFTKFENGDLFYLPLSSGEIHCVLNGAFERHFRGRSSRQLRYWIHAGIFISFILIQFSPFPRNKLLNVCSFILWKYFYWLALVQHTTYYSFFYFFFPDEAWFQLSGFVNSQNNMTWLAQNLHIVAVVSLHPIEIGDWVAMSSRRSIGPIFFRETK